MLLWIFKDGTFVVRDSSKGKAEHPYTLMVLKEGKVYNIKIDLCLDFYAMVWRAIFNHRI